MEGAKGAIKDAQTMGGLPPLPFKQQAPSPARQGLRSYSRGYFSDGRKKKI